MKNNVCVVIPDKLRNDAKRAGINLSALCRRAIVEAVQKLEPEEAQVAHPAKNETTQTATSLPLEGQT